MSEEQKPTEQTEDKELNELLDSALEDFDKAPKPEEPAGEAKAADDNAGVTVPQDTWTSDFIKEAANQFEKNLHSLIQNGTDGQIEESIQKMAQTVASLVTEGESEDPIKADFQSAIEQALKDLSATSENLQGETGLTEADIAAMLSQTSLEEGGGDILPFMQGMMQSLLSKEILYPSLKELVDKYPNWLESKKETLPAEELEKYNKQYDLMQKVCNELETEQEDDTEEIKKKRFETTLSLMQDIQNCGQPPEELVGDQPPLFQFDADGNPIIPTLPPGVDMPQNCSIM